MTLHHIFLYIINVVYKLLYIKCGGGGGGTALFFVEIVLWKLKMKIANRKKKEKIETIGIFIRKIHTQN